MKIAFKEWGVVVNALGLGAQVVILRKGGIHENQSGFNLEHQSFLLFPTLFHQQYEAITPESRLWFGSSNLTNSQSDSIRIQYCARVIASAEVQDFPAVKRLSPLHIWNEETVAQKFSWGDRPMVHAFFLQVAQLPTAVDISASPSYVGCRSWIELQCDIATSEAKPVLTENELEQKLQSFDQALGCASVRRCKISQTTF